MLRHWLVEAKAMHTVKAFLGKGYQQVQPNLGFNELSRRLNVKILKLLETEANAKQNFFKLLGSADGWAERLGGRLC